MKTKWKKTKYPGIRYYEHHTRKHGVGKDRYFAIRYQIEGSRKEEGLGWASEGWTVEKAAIERGNLKKAHITGEGATSLKEKRKEKKVEQDRIEQENKPFSVFFDEIYSPLSETNKKDWTCQKEKGIYNKWLKPAFGEEPLKNISPFHIEKLKKTMMDAGKSPRTIQYALAIVRQVWNVARNVNVVDSESPTKKVRPVRVDNSRLRFLTHEEADLLLKRLKESSEKLYHMSILSLHCGLRAGEIFNLEWQDIHVDKNFMILRAPKSGKTEIAFMTKEIRKMFAEMEPGNKNELIFKDRNGNKIIAVSNAFDRIVEELGFNTGIKDRKQRVVFHSLRHTYASWMVESGVDLYTVQKLMRHSTSKMTERYAHLGENTLQTAVKNFEMAIRKTRKLENKKKNVL